MQKNLTTKMELPIETTNLEAQLHEIFQSIKNEIRLSDGCYQQDLLNNDQHQGQIKKIMNEKNLQDISSYFFTDSCEDQLEKNCINYFLTNIVLMNRYRQIKEQNVKLRSRLRASNMNQSNIEYYNVQNTRQRKKKNEVDRRFPCIFPNCDKSYGSKNSLRQHMRNKHFEYFKQANIDSLSVLQDSQQNTKNLDESLFQSESEINFDFVDDNDIIN